MSEMESALVDTMRAQSDVTLDHTKALKLLQSILEDLFALMIKMEQRIERLEKTR